MKPVELNAVFGVARDRLLARFKKTGSIDNAALGELLDQLVKTSGSIVDEFCREVFDVMAEEKAKGRKR